MEPIIINDGETYSFSSDGDFKVSVKDGRATVIPDTRCFINRGKYIPTPLPISITPRIDIPDRYTSHDPLPVHRAPVDPTKLYSNFRSNMEQIEYLLDGVKWEIKFQNFSLNVSLVLPTRVDPDRTGVTKEVSIIDHIDNPQDKYTVLNILDSILLDYIPRDSINSLLHRKISNETLYSAKMLMVSKERHLISMGGYPWREELARRLGVYWYYTMNKDKYEDSNE